MMYLTAHSFAKMAHANQKDKNGEDYIHHVERVVDNLPRIMDMHLYYYIDKIISFDVFERDLAIDAAWLHDVLEDTETTLVFTPKEAILNHINGFSCSITKELAVILMLLTFSKTEVYRHYIEDLSTNKIARVVKLADITDNMNKERLERLSSGTSSRLIRKYTEALKILNFDLPT